MKQEIIKKENIELMVIAKDWKDAIIKSGGLLKKNGFIREGYIQDMISAVENLGPYIVIAPHIAIAHARPSDDVLQDGISLVTLKEPIEFGNLDNDPVYLVFSLCAKSTQGHLSVLQDLANILGDEEKIDILRYSKDIDEVYSILNNN